MSALKKINFRKDDQRELGYGSPSAGQRLMNHDGSSNIIRKGTNRYSAINIYHNLITMPWSKFNLLVFTGYSILNLLFACVYVIIGVDQIAGMTHGDSIHKFWEAFFFSAQSFTT